MADVSKLKPGLVVASHGRHVWVETPDGQRLICHPRGKKSQTVVGDHVLWQASADEGTIEKVQTRRNLFYRQDEVRTKSFAANLDQIVILIAAEPEFSETQLAYALIAAEAEHIRPIIALNKSDLTQPFERAWQRLAVYRAMGYSVLPMALKPRGPATTAVGNPLDAVLQGKTTLVLGPSGSGKSTLINRLLPQAQVLTQDLSSALNAGKHTTTSTTLYWVDAQRTTAVIDSPGFQEFGLQHIEPMRLASLMPDMLAHTSQCRFYNCSHTHEPGCSAIAAVAAVEPPSDAMEGNSAFMASTAYGISARRYKIYSDLFAALSQKRY